MLCAILSGWCGLSEFELLNSSIDYLYHRWNGQCLKMQAEERRSYEVARYQAMYGLVGKTKKPIKNVHELGKFPWEKTEKKLTKNEAERLKEYGTKASF